MTLLELIQQVYGELGLSPQPSGVVSSQDPQVIQMLALLNRLGDDVCRQFDWQRLDNQYVITAVAQDTAGDTVEGSNVITNIPDTSAMTTQWEVFGPGINQFANIISVDNATTVTMSMPATATATGAALTFAQTQYNLPADWKKQIPQTEWDNTNRWPLMGPASPQDWQSFKSGIVYAGPRLRYRIQANTLTLNPQPSNGWVFSFEYISKFWVIGADGTRKARFTADTDTFIFDDSLMTVGLKAKWMVAKGLDATFDLGEFKGLLDNCKAQDKSAKKLSLSPYQTTILLSMANLPDGSFPSSN